MIAHLNRDFRRAVIQERRGEQPRRDDVPWLARLRSGPWLQSDPGDQSTDDQDADA